MMSSREASTHATRAMMRLHWASRRLRRVTRFQTGRYLPLELAGSPQDQTVRRLINNKYR